MRSCWRAAGITGAFLRVMNEGVKREPKSALRNTMIDTRLLTIDPTQVETPTAVSTLQLAAQIIQHGGLVAFPTETVYGLGADALNATAVARIFAAKKRPFYDPLIVHVASAAELARVAQDVPPLAHELAARFWPGPLTLVLPRNTAVPDVVSAGGPTVAVRCPAHPIALALIRAAGTPIAAPSANRFSHTSPTSAQHVWDDLAGEIELILDGGPTLVGVESTVLDVTGDVPVLLRPGGITLEALQAVLPRVEVRRQLAPPGPELPSPGLLERHYAPQTTLWLFTGEDEAVRRAMQETAVAQQANGRSVALLLAEEDVPFFAGAAGETAVLQTAVVGSLNDLEGVARRLFYAMRQLDRLEVSLILARDFPPVGLGLAVHDRLARAAERVIPA